MRSIAEYRKFAVAAASVIAILIATAAFPPHVTHWLSIVLSSLGALGVYAVPNAPASDTHTAS